MRLAQLNKKGFTLVEVLVATFFMTMMIVVVSGILVHNLRLQRFSLERQELLSETSYALEYMSRSIRMARSGENGNYNWSNNCLTFLNYDPTKGEQKFCLIEDALYEVVGENSFNLTSDKLKVHRFQVFPQEGVRIQPLVTLVIEASLAHEEEATIKVQTSISQRALNI